MNGTEIAINTDFRFCLKTILAFENNELTEEEKIYILLMNMYGAIPTEHIQEYIDKAIWFLNCCEDEPKDAKENPRLYSFEKDSKYIYAAMKQSVGFDFNKEIHWWDFINAFMSLDNESFFSKIIHLRNKKRKGKLTKEELNYYRENADILELEEDVTYEENEKLLEFKKLLKESD